MKLQTFAMLGVLAGCASHPAPGAATDARPATDPPVAASFPIAPENDGAPPHEAVERILATGPTNQSPVARHTHLCYELALRDDPNLAGRVVIRFEVSIDGKAHDARDAGSDPQMPAPLIACIARGFDAVDLPPRAKPGTVDYPIVLSPGE